MTYMQRFPNRLAAIALLGGLAACGGDGGATSKGGAGVVIAPAPTPTPTPSPVPPPVATSVFGALGQTASQSFASLGIAFSGVEVGGWGDLAIEPASVDPNRPIGLRFAAPAQLLLSVGGVGEGLLSPNGGGGTDDRGRTTQLSYAGLGANASLALIRRTDGEYLTSTALGSWTSPPSSAGRAVYNAVQFAYGVATPANQVPSTGLAEFAIPIGGYIALAAPGDDAPDYYGGQARLSVNFGTRTVSGTLAFSSFYTDGQSATLTLAQVALTNDGMGFQGQLTSTTGGTAGFIEGRFTGPAAREMIVRWRGPPIQIGTRTGVAFGVWGASAG